MGPYSTEEVKKEFLLMEYVMQWLIRTHFRRMTAKDLHEVLQIERQRPLGQRWNKFLLLQHLNERGKIAVVAQRHEQVAGYAVYQNRKKTIYLLNIAVRKDDQRTGVGRLLVNKITDRLDPVRNRLLTLVPNYDIDANLFFKALGFKLTGDQRFTQLLEYELRPNMWED